MLASCVKHQSLGRLEHSCLRATASNGFRATRQYRAHPTHVPHPNRGPNSRRFTARSALRPWFVLPTTLLVFCGAGVWAYENYQPFRHSLLAIARCSRIAGALWNQRLPIHDIDRRLCGQRLLYLGRLTTKGPCLLRTTLRKLSTRRTQNVTSGVRRGF